MLKVFVLFYIPSLLKIQDKVMLLHSLIVWNTLMYLLVLVMRASIVMVRESQVLVNITIAMVT